MRRIILAILLTASVSSALAVIVEPPPKIDLKGWNTPPGSLYCYGGGMKVLSQTLTLYKDSTLAQDFRRFDRWSENGVVVVEHHYARKDGLIQYNDYYIREGKVWNKFRLPDEYDRFSKASAERQKKQQRGELVACKK